MFKLLDHNLKTIMNNVENTKLPLVFTLALACIGSNGVRVIVGLVLEWLILLLLLLLANISLSSSIVFLLVPF